MLKALVDAREYVLLSGEPLDQRCIHPHQLLADGAVRARCCLDLLAEGAPRIFWSFNRQLLLEAPNGDDFVHESIIGSLFNGRIEAATTVGGRDAIVPSVEGWARITGLNTLFIDDRDPFVHGFQVV